MKVPTHSDSFQVLLLQAADDGRGPALFGESRFRARELLLPFMMGDEFPDVYFEHPLFGEPFLDVTLLYTGLQPGMRVESPLAGEHGAVFDWFANVHKENENVSFGFELDTKEDEPPIAAVHFQPRGFTELVRPFFEACGEPERANLYLDLAARMPDDWPLSFFGMFRGRAASPLRICGYLDSNVKESCAEDPAQLARVFDKVGFNAYDDVMLTQVSTLMATAPGGLDFQFDAYPDGSLGDIFAIDAQFEIEQPERVRESFTSGPGARVMGLLERWGVADGRWKLAADAAFARSLPVELDDGKFGRYAFTLMPQWVKVRWVNGELQPAKLYHIAHAGLLESAGRAESPSS